MTIQIDRYISDAEIEACATDILQKYGRKFKPISAPPVPIEEIIDLVVDIPIVREATPDYHGSPVLAKLVARGYPHPALEIIVNDNKHLFFEQYKGTEEYSLAHELGHDVLHIDHGSLNTLLLPELVPRWISTTGLISILSKTNFVSRFLPSRTGSRSYIWSPSHLTGNSCPIRIDR